MNHLHSCAPIPDWYSGYRSRSWLHLPDLRWNIFPSSALLLHKLIQSDLQMHLINPDWTWDQQTLWIYFHPQVLYHINLLQIPDYPEWNRTYPLLRHQTLQLATDCMLTLHSGTGKQDLEVKKYWIRYSVSVTEVQTHHHHWRLLLQSVH